MESIAAAEADESLPYGATRGMLSALRTALKRRDPQDHRARIKNSSGGRRDVNLLRRLPKKALLQELLRREAIEQKRINNRERVQRYRSRKAREKAAEAAPVVACTSNVLG